MDVGIGTLSENYVHLYKVKVIRKSKGKIAFLFLLLHYTTVLQIMLVERKIISYFKWCFPSSKKFQTFLLFLIMSSDFEVAFACVFWYESLFFCFRNGCAPQVAYLLTGGWNTKSKQPVGKKKKKKKEITQNNMKFAVK